MPTPYGSVRLAMDAYLAKYGSATRAELRVIGMQAAPIGQALRTAERLRRNHRKGRTGKAEPVNNRVDAVTRGARELATQSMIHALRTSAWVEHDGVIRLGPHDER